MKRLLLLGLIVIFALLIYGVFRFPSALSSPSGLVGVTGILAVYGLTIWFWIPSLEIREPQIIQTAMRSGLLIGAIFAVEMILEYILLPKDNTQMGLAEYGSVFLFFFLTGIYVAYRTSRFRDGLFTAIVSAMIGSVIWLTVVLLIFYLFHGTPQQAQVFRAEGNFEDFAQSGMTVFDAFIMQDFWGAGFFHSILLPLLAAVLGSAGSLIGIFFAWLRKAKRNRIE